MGGVSRLGAADAQGFPGIPGGLPNGWRELGGDASPAPPTRRDFDFGLDRFRAQPERRSPLDGPGRGEGRYAPENSGTAADRAKESAAAARLAKFKAARAENLKRALAPHEPPETQRRRIVDELFNRLRAASDAEEAHGVAAAIERVWLQSQSDSAELLMQRALISIQSQNYPVALSLFDDVLALEPEWTEAWNQRAMARFLANDWDGAMADIDHALKLEPRHFGALAGMGLILERAGLDERALRVFNRALEIYPLQPDLRKNAEKLRLEIEGRHI